jgi:hypothetical protein
MSASKTKEVGVQKLLTQRDVARMLGISSDRIREYNTHAGLLEYVSLPGLNKPRYTAECVETFLEWPPLRRHQSTLVETDETQY